LSPIAKKKGLTLHYKIASSVPNVLIDSRRILQVFWNLIGNGIKFTDRGGVSVKVKKVKKTDDCPDQSLIEQVEVQIIDTGIGISSVDIPLVFKEFHQLSSCHNKRPFEGTGIGLGVPISREIITLHGGTLSLHSELGVGSIFTFTLPTIYSTKQLQSPLIEISTTPRRQLSNFENKPLPTPNQQPIPEIKEKSSQQEVAEILSQNVQKKTTRKSLKRVSVQTIKMDIEHPILCVDDNEMNLKILERFLNSYPIVTTDNGRDAVEIVSKQPISIVLMDVMMPIMDGYEATTLIRKTHPTLPILFVTARNEEEKGYVCGGNGYLNKPINKSDLLKQIQKFIRVS
jgi:CheY-like chemotaxis protein